CRAAGCGSAGGSWDGPRSGRRRRFCQGTVAEHRPCPEEPPFEGVVAWGAGQPVADGDQVDPDIELGELARGDVGSDLAAPLPVLEENREGPVGRIVPLFLAPAAEEELGVPGEQRGELPVAGEGGGKGGHDLLEPLGGGTG